MKRNLSHLIFDVVVMKQKQRNKARKNSKKTRKVTKLNKRTRKDKKNRERERQRVKRRSEWSQGERKGDTKKWAKITLFHGGKQCFCKQPNKKHKEKKGLGPTAPKHTCRVVSTQTQEENAEKNKTRKEEKGGVSKDPFSNSQKRCRKKSPGNSEKPIRTAAASRFLATARLEPKPRHSCAPKTRQKFHKLVPAREEWEKRHSQNVLSSAAPSRFFAFQTQFGQKFELPKKQICETPKNYSQKNCAASRRYNGSNASERGTTTQNCSETPCFQVFRVLVPLGLRLEDPRPETRAKNENFSGPQKTTSKMAFLKKT